MKVYYNLDDMSLTRPKDIPLELLAIFFDTEIGSSTKSYRSWLTEHYSSTRGNMCELIKEHSNIRLQLQEGFDNLYQHLIITQKNFVELLDTWDNLAMKKRIREVIFFEIDGCYRIRPYDKEQDQDILASNQ